MSDDKSILRELKWSTLVLGNYHPEDFDTGNWTSDQGDTFPIDVVLGLQGLSNVYKVVIDVDDLKIPSRISLSIGFAPVDMPIDYKTARVADFEKPIKMEYFKRERSQSRMESKSVFADNIGQFVWLQIENPLAHLQNPTRQVKIRKVTIFGYPMTEQQKKEIKQKKSSSKPSSRASIRPATSDIHHPMKEEKVKQKNIERYSYNGDGMKSTDSMLGGDPLSTIRTVKRTIIEKRDLAKEDDREIEATICMRSIQRLTEYEAMIEDLAERRSVALANGDMHMAERFRLSMVDCRDTALRVIHVDLLLGRRELSSIGVNSEWSDQP